MLYWLQWGTVCASVYNVVALVSSVNFLPRFNKVDRQKFALLAMGTARDISYYESLHQPVLMNEHLQDDHEKASSTEKISSLLTTARLLPYLKNFQQPLLAQRMNICPKCLMF